MATPSHSRYTGHSLTLLLLFLLSFTLTTATPAGQGRGRSEGDEGGIRMRDNEGGGGGGQEELEDLGLLPEEVDAIRNVLIEVMDILDDGPVVDAQNEPKKNKKCHKKKKCKSKKPADEGGNVEAEGEAEEEDEEDVVIIVVEDEEHDPSDVTLASLLYDEEADWGPCTRSCRAYRYRQCLYPTLCGEEELREEGLCYVPGSRCQATVTSFLEEEGYVIIDTTEDEVLEDDPSDPDFNPDYDYGWGDWGLDSQDDDDEYGEHNIDYDPDLEYPDAEDNLVGDYYDYGWADYLAGNTGGDDPWYYDEAEEEEQGGGEEEETGRRGGEEEGQEEEEEEVEQEIEQAAGGAAAGAGLGEGCGKRKVKGREDLLRIIGGREASEGAWPWTVAVLNRFKEVFCGGTLIAPRWVLTAAHCMRKRLYVRVGEHDIRAYSTHEMEMRVEASFPNPDYDEEVIESDIALLKLPTEVRYTRYVQPACLPRPSTPPPARSKCVVAGWGKERETHIFGSDVLNYARVPIVTKAACRKAYPDHPITRNHFCAGNKKGTSDTCAGDSGGPLVCEDGAGSWTVHGVTSFGEGCGDRGKFGVYTKVTNFLPWIKKIIREN